MSFTFTTSEMCKIAAGANTSEGDILGSQFDDWSDKAENEICSIAAFDCITNYGSLTDPGKRILGMMEDSIIGQLIINYDPGAIGVSEAKLRLNFLDDKYNKMKQLINDKNIRNYLAIT